MIEFLDELVRDLVRKAGFWAYEGQKAVFSGTNVQCFSRIWHVYPKSEKIPWAGLMDTVGMGAIGFKDQVLSVWFSTPVDPWVIKSSRVFNEWVNLCDPDDLDGAHMRLVEMYERKNGIV